MAKKRPPKASKTSNYGDGYDRESGESKRRIEPDAEREVQEIPARHMEGQEPEEGEDDNDLCTEACERFEMVVQAENDNRERAAEDVRFRDGDQWPADVKAEREAEGRPMLTINRVEEFVDAITGELRQNRPSIRVSAKRTGPKVITGTQIPNIDGTKAYDLAQVYEGLIRDIEAMSKFHRHLDEAGDHAAGHGFGYLRVLTQYCDPYSFDLELLIRSIANPFSVYIDPAAELPLKEDMMWAFITDVMNKSEFERVYPDARSSFDEVGSSDHRSMANWFTPEGVRIAEYFRRVPKDSVLYLLSDGRVVTEDNMKGIEDELKEQGVNVVDERETKVFSVEWRRITASEVLEGPIEFPSTYIPIIPVYGKKLFVEGRAIYRGAVRHLKDPQKLYNYWRTHGAERIALAAKDPWIVEENQLGNHKQKWATANRKNPAYLPYKHSNGVAAPFRAPPIGVDTAVLEQQQSAERDMYATASMREPALGQTNKERSGKAIAQQQVADDRKNFHYTDNVAAAVEHVGCILVEAIPRVFDTARVLRMRLIDGKEDFVAVNQEITDKQTGDTKTLYNLAAARMHVTVHTGPSYLTQRQLAADAQMELMKVLGPDLAKLIAPTVVRNMDWPQADIIAKYLEALIPPEVKMAVDAADSEGGGDEKSQLLKQMQQYAEGLKQQLMAAMQELESKKAERDGRLQEQTIKSRGEIAKAQAEVEIARIEARTAEMTAAHEATTKRLEMQMQQIQAALQALNSAGVDGTPAGQNTAKVLQAMQAVLEGIHERLTGDAEVQIGDKTVHVHRLDDGSAEVDMGDGRKVNVRRRQSPRNSSGYNA